MIARGLARRHGILAICIGFGGVLSFAPSAWAAAGGESSLSVLKAGTGARAAALGEAYAALGDDVFVAAYNPAGIGRLSQKQAGLFHGAWFGGTSLEYAALAWPLRGGHVVGASAVLLRTGDIDRTFADAGGDLDAARSAGTFTASELAAGVLYAHRLRGAFLGAQLKYIRSDLDDRGSQTAAVDVGVQSDDLGRVRLGVGLLNLGGRLGGDRLPGLARVGGSFAVTERLKVPVELSLPLDGSRARAGGGVEFWLDERVALRAGVQTGDPVVPSGGAGLRWRDVALDYAFVWHAVLRDTHRVSVSYRFGRSLEVAE